jgi:Ulp1 family protease
MWQVRAGRAKIRDMPQQLNTVDCGIFAILFADFISEDLSLAFSQDDIHDYRIRVALAILRTHL